MWKNNVELLKMKITVIFRPKLCPTQFLTENPYMTGDIFKHSELWML